MKNMYKIVVISIDKRVIATRNSIYAFKKLLEVTSSWHALLITHALRGQGHTFSRIGCKNQVKVVFFVKKGGRWPRPIYGHSARVIIVRISS